MTAPTFASEAAFQTAVVRLARERGWGMTEAQWGRQQEEAEAYSRHSGDAAALLGRMDGYLYHTRYSLGSDSGMPDLMLARLRDRRLVFAELKVGSRPKPRQLAVLELLRSCGAEAYLWRPADWDEIGRVLA